MSMKTLHLMAASAAMSALLIFAAAKVDAQQRPVGGGPRNNFASHGRGIHGGRLHGGGRHGFHGGFGGGWWVSERETVIEREVVVREVPAAPVAAVVPPAPPREPYVVGNSYASLPGSCMKLIEDGASFYYCSGGEWYKQTGKLYRAVERRL